MKNKTTIYFTTKQGTLPIFISEFLDINDPVLVFHQFMEGIDLNHLYIDGSKFEANANKYSWVWKKATEKFRYKIFEKITVLITEMNTVLAPYCIRIETNVEYVPEELEAILERYATVFTIDPNTFVSGKGHRKTLQQRHYELLRSYIDKLSEYIEKIAIYGDGRNSYSKTDNSATFMRIKTDYIGNDQLLPAYNVQFGVADEYIAVMDVNQYRSDMDCFVPLMEKFHEQYGFYPKYPIADAGYGSYNNYLYCEQHGMEKYMKFPMYKNESTDKNYHDNPFRAVNYRRDEDGTLRCPNGRKSILPTVRMCAETNMGARKKSIPVKIAAIVLMRKNANGRTKTRASD